jgi:putative transposase
VDFIDGLSATTEIAVQRLVGWLGLSRGKYYAWRGRYGTANEHNGKIPRDHWLEDWERQAILDYHAAHPLEGYRRLSFMMLDADLVAVSPSTTYRVLSAPGTVRPRRRGPAAQLAYRCRYINVAGTFYARCSTGSAGSAGNPRGDDRGGLEVIVQRAREKYPDATPRIISDNGPQFIARDFKTFASRA